MLAHYGYVCQLEGPRCTGYATTVHHLIPSSQAPYLFWEPSNLVAACQRCNYGDSSRVASDNRRQQIAYLQQLADEQQQQINRLLEKVARYENGESAKPRAPAVY